MNKMTIRPFVTIYDGLTGKSIEIPIQLPNIFSSPIDEKLISKGYSIEKKEKLMMKNNNYGIVKKKHISFKSKRKNIIKQSALCSCIATSSIPSYLTSNSLLLEYLP